MDEYRLDGNSVAGALGEVFSFEVTTTEYTCDGCGKTGELGAAMAYEVRHMGTVVRCPGCDKALIRLSYAGGLQRVDFRGMRYLAID